MAKQSKAGKHEKQQATQGNPDKQERQQSSQGSPDKQELIQALNEDLSKEFSAIQQYITYAAQASGPMRLQLNEFFMGEVPDETGHAQFLANKIVAMGGTPVAEAAPVAEARDNHQMLERVLEAERDAISGYTERAKQAEEFGDKGLQVQLEDMVRQETEHYEETERILREWPRGDGQHNY
jgi:bacterioferritin